MLVGELDGYIEENNGNKYLNIALTDSSSEVLKNMLKFGVKLKTELKKKNNSKLGEYEKDYMRIKFNSDDDLPLNKILKFRILTIIIRAIFEKDGKYYPQVFLDECFHEI